MSESSINQQAIADLFGLPFFDLITKARQVYQANFKQNDMQMSSLLSIKTGACPEDCGYCSQSGRYKTGLQKQSLLDVDVVVEKAKQAKAKGAQRFCMGAAWRNPPAKDFPKVIEMVKQVKKLGLETCVTLGLLDQQQAQALKQAGLDYYNHNLDTSPEHYKKIISSHTYDQRLQTISHVMDADINVCCGGIMGMGESREDRVEFLYQLTRLPKTPKSIPINRLIPMPGTPLADTPALDNFEFIRTIAVARIVFPQSRVRLSAGRDNMSDEMQAWCFMAGANSIFFGDVLLTASNPEHNRDKALLEKLDINV